MGTDINVAVEFIGQMMEVKTKYNILIKYLLNNSTLNYSKTELRIDGCENIIKALEPEKYDARFDILRCEDKINNE